MQVKSTPLSAILLTFVKLPFVIKLFVLTIFEWPRKIGFKMDDSISDSHYLKELKFSNPTTNVRSTKVRPCKFEL